jgi:hypothetical protein
MKTISEALEEIIPKGTRCEGCPKADPFITGSEGKILNGYQGPYFCHLMEEVIEDGDKKCMINDPRTDILE